ncbi:MAG: SGNH/GDSL hydrolase family protein [Clostridia bacterium]|nr:SGNH/GDSL hydrolase family protein [Clostridia bacterium]
MSEFSIRFNSGYDITVPNPPGTDTPTEVQKIIDRLNAVHDYRGTLLKERFKDDLSRLNGRRTVFIGDSITRDNLGYRATVTLAGKPKACNLAVSGTISAMLLNKFKRSVKSFKPELVSIMIGGNDALLTGDEQLPSVSITEYKRNVSAFVRWAKEAGAAVLLFEITPIHEARFKAHYDGKEKYQTNENISSYNGVLKEISLEYDIPLYPNGWLSENPDLYYEKDGIHLSEKGHEAFALKWMEYAVETCKEHANE